MELFSGIVNNILKGSDSLSLNQRIISQISSVLNSTTLTNSSITSNLGNLLNINIPQLEQFLPDGLKFQLQSKLDNFTPQNIKLNITNAEINLGKLSLTGSAIFSDANNQQKIINFNADGFVKLQQQNQSQPQVSQQPLNNLAANLTNPLSITDALTLQQSNNDLSAPIKAFLGEDVKQNTLSFLSENSNSQNLTKPEILKSLNQNGVIIKINDYTLPDGQRFGVQDNLQNAIQNTNLIAGKVDVQPNSNEVLIKTELGVFRLVNNINLPQGTNINIAIEDIIPSENFTNLQNFANANINSVRNIFTSENSIFSNLVKDLYSNASTSNVVSRLFANPSERFSALKALWFVSASKNGNAEKFANDEVVNALQTSTGNGLQYKKDLEEVFSFLKNFAPSQNQQGNLAQVTYSYLLPFYDGKNINFATIHIEKNPEDSKKDQDAQKRFWLEFLQEETGKIEIEGKYITSQNGKLLNLDVNIATDVSFDDDFQKDLLNYYFEIANLFDFSGNLSFKNFTQNNNLTAEKHILGEGIVI
jgi:hypothetical protein